jgi:Vitamin B12 dependent methionine synthase, activation domain.
MPKTIGVSLSDSLLMTPTKSITAVIGLSKNRTDCHTAGCEECNMSSTCGVFEDVEFMMKFH